MNKLVVEPEIRVIHFINKEEGCTHYNLFTHSFIITINEEAIIVKHHQ